MFKTLKVAGFALVAAFLLYTVACTTYYNFFDPHINELKERFGRWDWDKGVACSEPEREQGHIVVSSYCSGGVLEDRDNYLKENHIFALGDWRKGQGLPWGDATFRFYFKYGW